jgi:hypothetical protein
LALGATAYLADKLNDHICDVAPYTAPADLYVKLHTGSPGASGTSNAAAETTRKVIVFGSSSSGGTISNTSAITWTGAAATETITHVSIWDASSGGNCLATGSLAVSVNVLSGGTIPIPIGELDFVWSLAS